MNRRAFLALLAGVPFLGRAFVAAAAEPASVDAATFKLRSMGCRSAWSYELGLHPPRSCDTCLTTMSRYERAYLRRGGKPQRCRACRRVFRNAARQLAYSEEADILDGSISEAPYLGVSRTVTTRGQI